MTRIDLSATASDSVRRLNPAIFGGGTPKTHADAKKTVKRVLAREAAKTPAGAICGGNSGITRQKRMNKTEARAMEWLRLQGFTDIIAQPTRLFPLAGGGSYTPDFLAWVPGEPGVLVVEVKGGYRGPGWEQGYERYRRAALQYSCHLPWSFALLTWHARRREWTFEAWAVPSGE